MISLIFLVACFCPVMSQLAGTKIEEPPEVDVAHCTKSGGCTIERTNATLDANWRWIHGVKCYGEQCWSSGNCYTGDSWDSSKCPDPKTCAETCALEAVTKQEYRNTYGVTAIPGGVELKFKTGMNIGSRLYLTEAGGQRYKLFKLKNREFAFDVDVSTLACGINGAVYFSEMDADGGMGGRNKAGAKYGTGYCDAQCPHDVKFINGEANIEEWNSSTHFGKYGVCCAEMDIWEANRAAEALTTHPCNITGPKVCNGLECGGLPDESQYRYQGVCDKDGCDMNPYRDGEKEFFGEGSMYTVDTQKPFTIVTQWLTSDGTDAGDLSEIRRLYVQDGKVIANARASILPGKDRDDVSITDEYCDAQKATFGDPNQHKAKGGLKSMGEALDRGVVLVLSIWDDSLSHMLWLDSSSGDPNKPGNARGPCATTSGSPNEVRAKYANAYVRYTNVMYGEINSTYTNPMPTAAPTPPPSPPPPSPVPNPMPVPSPVPSPMPSPSPVPPVPSPVSGNCCWGPCQSPYSCSVDGDWCSQNSNNCEGNCGGNWCGSSALLDKANAKEVKRHGHLRGDENEVGAMMQTSDARILREASAPSFADTVPRSDEL